MYFRPIKTNEEAGLVVYRKSSTHYKLLKQKDKVVLVKTVATHQKGTESSKEIVAAVPYSQKEVCFRVVGKGLDLNFYYGETEDSLKPIGGNQDFSIVSDEIAGRFNGTVAGLYASSKGRESKNLARFKMV